MQFYGCFTYNEKGPCYIYRKETDAQKAKAAINLAAENLHNKSQREDLVSTARTALREMGDADVNQMRKQAWSKAMELKRNDRTRGGVDGYRHREEVLKPLVVPWLKQLKQKGKTDLLLLEDSAPAHISRFDTKFLDVNGIKKLCWPGHSPDVNAEEHAWPWIRRHITNDFEPSRNEDECELQWITEWKKLPQGVINKWIDSIPGVVRQIIAHSGDNSFHDG
jgi:hypothetical protein